MSGKFALIIGNHAYRNPGLAPLTAPGKIAAALARFLESKHLCSFNQIQVFLNGPGPTVREAIDSLFGPKMPGDLLVWYFSGHGIRGACSSFYLGVRSASRLRLQSTAIESDFVRKSMHQSRSRRQMLVKAMKEGGYCGR